MDPKPETGKYPARSANGVWARSLLDALKAMRHGGRIDPWRFGDAAISVRDYPGMPVLIPHGERDGIVAKIDAAQAALQWLCVNRFIDAQGELIDGTCIVLERDDRWVVDYRRSGCCIVRRLGHAPSGGDARVPFHAVKGPDVGRGCDRDAVVVFPEPTP